ncbi:hypothetical protein LUZ60_009228 [Juncus effusus]|nr:hypothetical protein LUZ60_009228 [Juncus effusus]
MNFFRSVLFVDPEEPDAEEAAAAAASADAEIAAAASAAAAATMDFFKSVISTAESDPDEAERQDEDLDQDRAEQQQTSGNQEERGGIDEGEEEEEEEEEGEGTSGAWGLGFGGLMKTFADKSGTVIRDLGEFGQGLKAETAVLRDVASKALDVGASAAQESLESMGQVVDDLGDTFRQGTKEILSQSKEALLSLDSPSSPSLSSESDPDSASRPSISSLPILTRLTRFESQMLAARSDPATFADPPEDQSDFDTWRSKFFKIEEKKDEIEVLMKENSQLEVFLEKLVPNLVDEETFWSRYFYKVYKINQAEDARAKIVKMAKKGDEDEDLSWEVEEEEEEEEKQEETKIEAQKEEEKEKEKEKEVVNEQEAIEGTNGESNGEEMASKSSEFSMVSRSQSQTGEEEEDLGWEAIEELEGEKKEEGSNKGPNSNITSSSGSDAKVEDLRKRLSLSGDKEEEEEELSWDIEDEEDVGPASKT